MYRRPMTIFMEHISENMDKEEPFYVEQII